MIDLNFNLIPHSVSTSDEICENEFEIKPIILTHICTILCPCCYFLAYGEY